MQIPHPTGITGDGKQLYVSNGGSNNVSVIDTSSNTVSATITVGNDPETLGTFIQGVSLGPSAVMITNGW